MIRVWEKRILRTLFIFIVLNKRKSGAGLVLFRLLIIKQQQQGPTSGSLFQAEVYTGGRLILDNCNLRCLVKTICVVIVFFHVPSPVFRVRDIRAGQCGYRVEAACVGLAAFPVYNI